MIKNAYDEDLTLLDDGIRRLKIEFDIFFGGHRKKPPEDLRLRVERIIRRLSEASNLTITDRFRYNTLIARYYVYRDLWRRNLQTVEAQGKEALIKTASPSPPKTPAAVEPTTRADAVKVAISDPEQDGEKVRQLYDFVMEMRGRQANQPASISYDQFAKYIATQTSNIRGKYGCSSVEFDISLQEDTVKFIARVGS